jgi:hypothetical protein
MEQQYSHRSIVLNETTSNLCPFTLLAVISFEDETADVDEETDEETLAVVDDVVVGLLDELVVVVLILSKFE